MYLTTDTLLCNVGLEDTRVRLLWVAIVQYLYRVRREGRREENLGRGYTEV